MRSEIFLVVWYLSPQVVPARPSHHHPPPLQYSYANLSLLFARYHAKLIPWGHKTADFVALGFQDSDEDEDEDDHEWE